MRAARSQGGSAVCARPGRGGVRGQTSHGRLTKILLRRHPGTRGDVQGRRGSHRRPRGPLPGSPAAWAVVPGASRGGPGPGCVAPPRRCWCWLWRSGGRRLRGQREPPGPVPSTLVARLSAARPAWPGALPLPRASPGPAAPAGGTLPPALGGSPRVPPLLHVTLPPLG